MGILNRIEVFDLTVELEDFMLICIAIVQNFFCIALLSFILLQLRGFHVN